MVRFMKGVHDDINQTFSAFNQGTVRPYHGTMPAVMFFKHIFHCSIVDNPLNIVNEPGKVSNLNTVISRVYVHRRKKLMDEGQRKFGFPFNLGDLLSHTIHLRRLCEPCVFTHTCKRKRKPSPTSSPLTHRGLLRNSAP